MRSNEVSLFATVSNGGIGKEELEYQTKDKGSLGQGKGWVVKVIEIFRLWKVQSCKDTMSKGQEFMQHFQPLFPSGNGHCDYAHAGTVVDSGNGEEEVNTVWGTVDHIREEKEEDRFFITHCSSKCLVGAGKKSSSQSKRVSPIFKKKSSDKSQMCLTQRSV